MILEGLAFRKPLFSASGLFFGIRCVCRWNAAREAAGKRPLRANRRATPAADALRAVRLAWNLDRHRADMRARAAAGAFFPVEPQLKEAEAVK